MTDEQILRLKHDLHQRIQDSMTRGLLSAEQRGAALGETIKVWQKAWGLSGDTLGFEWTVSQDESGNPIIDLQPFGPLARRFSEVHRPPVPPPPQRKVRGFDPLFGNNPEPEPGPGVPPVRKPHPRWLAGADPFWPDEG